VDRARVWSLPDEPPKLVAGAISPETAAWAADWADGLITVNQPPDLLRRVLGSYRDAGGRGELHLQVHLSWARDDETALAAACETWRSNCLPTSLAWELETPEQFEAATRHVPPDEVARNVLVSSDAGLLAERLHDYQQLGFDSLYLHPVGEDEEFIDVFGAEVLPKLGSPA
jgi:alkanesulfonate monooxygenase SsuD/methylene tetrahydromethanopterin reductase-like flavin-dependent oxidoreductase (luciferase family)